jgi:GABA permease
VKEVAMRRYLVVANQTLYSEVLLAELRARVKEGPSQFFVLVPATRPADGMVWTEGQVKKVTERRLGEALDRLRAEGFEADGQVGDASPVRAIGDVLLEQPDGFDEIILSTLPPGPSRWLHQDVPHRVQRTYRLPVTHVVAEPQPVA